MTPNPNTVFNGASQFINYRADWFQATRISLLTQIVQSLGGTTDPGTLLNQWGVLTPNQSSANILEIALLAQIPSGIQNSGIGQIVAYTGVNPNTDGVKPANTQLPAIAVKPGATTYTWSIAAQNWQ